MQNVHIARPLRTRLASFGVAAIAAGLVAAFAPEWLRGVPRAVAAYDAAVFVALVAMWALVIERDPKRTQQRAALQDPGRNATLAIVLVAVVAGLAAAIAILGKNPSVAGPHEKAVVYALAIGAISLGWLLIHTTFTLRYAHLYYYDVDDDNEADRGLKFPGDEEPSDMDFAYFSFVIGMTYQVSDVQIVDRRVRRFALYHALISFVYATMILALAINIVSGLLH